jgi:hypothetical protein
MKPELAGVMPNLFLDRKNRELPIAALRYIIPSRLLIREMMPKRSIE